MELGQEDKILVGQSNFVRWFPRFRWIAKAENVYKLFTGEEKLLPQPHRGLIDINFSLLQTEGLVAHSDGSAINDYRLGALIQSTQQYQMELDAYKDQRQRMRTARLLLANMVAPHILVKIEKCDTLDDAFDEIVVQYRMETSQALQIAHYGLKRLFKEDCPSIKDYLLKLANYRTDIEESQGAYADKEYLKKMLQGLDMDYDDFLEGYDDLLNDFGAEVPTVKSVEADILVEEKAIEWEKFQYQ